MAESPPRKSSIASFFSRRASKPGSIASIESRRSSFDLDESEKPPGASKRLRRKVGGSSLSAASSPTSPKKSDLPPSQNQPQRQTQSKLQKQPPVTLASTRVPRSDQYDRDKQTGEVKDHTNMLHSLAWDSEFDESMQQLSIGRSDKPRQYGSIVVSKLKPDHWRSIITTLSPSELASFALTCKAFRGLLDYDPIPLLNDPNSYRDRIDFLVKLDQQFPNHLLCFNCAKYHIRIQAGQEILKKTNIANKLYECPYIGSTDPTKKITRARIVYARTLPFTFMQLMTRESRFGPAYGVSAENDMGRRYKDPADVSTWSHQVTYAMIQDSLYMRAKSTCFAPPGLPPAGLRKLLYCSQEQFYPFFSVCEHWRDGELMPAAKCAISHIPKPIEGSGIARVGKEIKSRYQKQSTLISQCEFCKPIRRCPECPTEYAMEIRWEEDRNEKDPFLKFKYALIVTRWSNFGDGRVPWGREWAACIGEMEGYNSFNVLGRRAINGIFESYMSPEQIPPQRLISMNPSGEKLGEAGHNWW